MAPQPGTSQIPQEMGADATRDIRLVMADFLENWNGPIKRATI
ncbi:unannotated protein [freshwater metagenome]|uniref:Unannotated protein n=1 Tax=freshwater metagenome TaxID=449393 RepID=A0A6J6NCJ8_9ZZZZ